MTRRKTGAAWGIGVLVACLIAAAQQSWVERAVHNFGEPINTLWAEGHCESFANTMSQCPSPDARPLSSTWPPPGDHPQVAV